MSIFWNPTQRRVRAFWRILIQGSVWFALQIGASILVLSAVLCVVILTGRESAQDILASTERVMALADRPVVTMILEIAAVLITLAVVWLAGRLLDRRRFADFGFHFSGRWFMDLGFGLFLGAFLMAAVFFCELAAGWVTVEGFLVTMDAGGVFPVAILVPLVIFLCGGVSEEIFSRGYELRNLAEGLNHPRWGAAGAVWAGTVFSSILFGCMHLSNPNVTVLSIANLMSAGVFLALGFILTGELALPIGLHIAWNFFQGNVFGFPVSGLNPLAASFLSIRQGGPDWLTGGPFGPEGGLIGLGAMVLGSLIILAWFRITRGKISLARRLAEYPETG
jgi:membrane protease YdiL (CAAX protease family)